MKSLALHRQIDILPANTNLLNITRFVLQYRPALRGGSIRRVSQPSKHQKSSHNPGGLFVVHFTPEDFFGFNTAFRILD